MNTKTWKLDLENNRFLGKIDGIEAVKQAVYFILNTERFQYMIFSPNYGVELKNLIGQNRSYVDAIIESRIEEALTQDSRIKSVTDFSSAWKRSVLTLKFTVKTVYGNTDIEWEGIIDV